MKPEQPDEDEEDFEAVRRPDHDEVTLVMCGRVRKRRTRIGVNWMTDQILGDCLDDSKEGEDWSRGWRQLRISITYTVVLLSRIV